MNFRNIYGYEQDENGTITINEEQAQIVRSIYFSLLSGRSYSNICAELMERGIPAPKGGAKWAMSTIKTMLDNEKYIGDVLLQKTYMRDFLSNSRVKNTGQAKQKYIENNHPAIIDKATWYAVQAELERRNSLRTTEPSGRGRYSWQYAFSGKLFCGWCGAGFRRHGGDESPRWVCKQHIHSKYICPQKSIKEAYIESVFIQTINDFIKHRDELTGIVNSAVYDAMVEAGDVEKIQSPINKIDDEIEKLQMQVFELNKRRAKRLIETVTYFAETRVINEKLDALFVKRDLIGEEMTEAHLQNAQLEMVKDFIQNEKTQLKFDKDVFNKLVASVVIKSADDMVFKLRDGTTLKGIIRESEE